MSAIKESIVVKAAFLCLAHGLLIAMVWVNGGYKYASYRDGKALKVPVEATLRASSVDLLMARVFKNFSSFSNIFRITKLFFVMD